MDLYGRKRYIRKAAAALCMLAVMLFCFAGCSGGVKVLKEALFTREGFENWKAELIEEVRRTTEEVEEYLEKHPLPKPAYTVPDIYQVLLIGSDRREDNWYGNSDAMILLSVNRNKQTISLVSFMRDLGVNIPGYGYGKINSAYARGGPNLLVQTIEQDFQIEIDNYVATDFEGMSRMVDLFGGVTIDVQEAEIPVINGCVKEMCALQGIDPEPYYLTAAGSQHLNGIQAVGYSRNRSVGNCDFDRTARQRRVLEQVIANGKQKSLSQLLLIAAQSLPLVTHDITAEQMNALVAMIPSLKNYSLVMERVPYDGLYSFNNENLDPVWGDTIARLHAVLY